MIELGERQELIIVKTVDFGVYLAESAEGKDEQERILLPKKEVPENAQIGDPITVYVYRDSEDRMIATTRDPGFSVGETALLKVKEVGKIGAFLEWELEKDLMLPFKEQTGSIKPGQECLVALYVDKTGRLCTTMKVYHYLRTDSPYHKDDKVKGLVYEISERFGVFVAVDDCYSGLIPSREPAPGIQVGDRVEARVAEVLPDGKLTLSLREKAYIQMSEDAEKLLKLLEEAGGVLSVGDKSDPERIRDITGMSKNEFKRAAGNLYKQRLITISGEVIKRSQEDAQ